MSWATNPGGLQKSPSGHPEISRDNFDMRKESL